MASNITPASTFDTAIPVIDDGDSVNRATMVAQLQPIANRTEYLNDNKVKTVAAAESDLQDASAVSLEYAQPLVITVNNIGDGGTPSNGFQYVNATGVLQQGASPDPADACMIPLQNLPQQGTVTSVEVYLKGAAGHGSLPTMPQVTVKRKSISSGGSFASYGSKVDDSASVGAYEVRHQVTPTLTGPIDLATHQLAVEVTGESAVAGLVIDTIIAVVTLAKVTP